MWQDYEICEINLSSQITRWQYCRYVRLIAQASICLSQFLLYVFNLVTQNILVCKKTKKSLPYEIRLNFQALFAANYVFVAWTMKNYYYYCFFQITEKTVQFHTQQSLRICRLIFLRNFFLATPIREVGNPHWKLC